MYDVSHLLPQPHPTTFNPTLSRSIVTSPRTPSNTTTITIPHQGSDANNTSTIRAKCLAEHCASPENDSQGGGGGGGRYYYNGVGAEAAPGCKLRGGGKFAKIIIIIIIIIVLYGAHIHLFKDAQGACIIITQALAPVT